MAYVAFSPDRRNTDSLRIKELEKARTFLTMNLASPTAVDGVETGRGLEWDTASGPSSGCPQPQQLEAICLLGDMTKRK